METNHDHKDGCPACYLEAPNTNPLCEKHYQEYLVWRQSPQPKRRPDERASQDSKEPTNPKILK